MGAPIVRMRGITCSFGPVIANDSVDLDLFAGEIHALVGENGTGKSTLMHVLSGALPPDEGTIRLGASLVAWRSPRDAIEAGVGMVHQTPRLVDSFSIEENLRLVPRLGRGRPSRDPSRLLGERYGLRLPMGRTTGQTSQTMREYAALAALLLHPLRVLILDEPGATFAGSEGTAYFDLIRKIALEGVSVVCITHRLGEIAAIADRVSVMRKGRIVATESSDQLDVARMVSIMWLGSEREAESSEVPQPRPTKVSVLEHDGDLADSGPGPTIKRAIGQRAEREMLAIAGITGGNNASRGLRQVTLSVGQGEIAAVAGIREDGPGQLEEIVGGNDAPGSGQIVLGNRSYRSVTPRILRDHRIGYVPRERFERAVDMESDVWENVSLPERRKFTRHGLLSRRRIVESVSETLTKGLVSASASARVATLSGGTIQRLILEREIEFAIEVLIVSEPFWGLDAVGRSRVARLLREFSSRGGAVLVFAADLDDAHVLADTVHLFRGGEIVASLPSDQIDRDTVSSLFIERAP